MGAGKIEVRKLLWMCARPMDSSKKYMHTVLSILMHINR
jgi:hypothetical protein